MTNIAYGSFILLYTYRGYAAIRLCAAQPFGELTRPGNSAGNRIECCDTDISVHRRREGSDKTTNERVAEETVSMYRVCSIFFFFF